MSRGERLRAAALLAALALGAAGGEARAAAAPGSTQEPAPTTALPAPDPDPGVLPLSLEDAVDRALSTHEAVLLAVAQADLAEAVLRQVRSAAMPRLDAEATYTRNLERPVFFLEQDGQVREIAVGSDNEHDAVLTLEQPLFDFRLPPALRAARLARAAAEAGIADSRTAVALLARQAYYEALLARELVGVRGRAIVQAEDRLRQVGDFFEAGTAAEFDVLTARVEVDNLRPALIEAENRLRLARERLKRIVGVPFATEIELTGDFAPPSPLPPLEAAVAEALERRGDLAAQRLAVEAQEQRVERDRRTAFPQLDLTAEYRGQASTEDVVPDELVPSSNAQIRVTVPIYGGGEREAVVAQQKALLDTERLLLRRLEDDARLEVQEALLALRAAEESLQATAATVERAERALDIARVRFANGLSTQLELDDAELAVTEARSNVAAARYDYSVARARLAAAMGGEAAMQEVDALGARR